jgi:hypothetical protein
LRPLARDQRRRTRIMRHAEAGDDLSHFLCPLSEHGELGQFTIVLRMLKNI